MVRAFQNGKEHLSRPKIKEVTGFFQKQRDSNLLKGIIACTAQYSVLKPEFIDFFIELKLM